MPYNLRGVAAANKRLTPDQVEKLRRMRGDGMTLSEIGKEFNLSPSAVSRICAGKTYGPLAAR